LYPVLTLTERATTRCRLSPTVVGYLLQRHRTCLTILPTNRRHHYQVTPAGRIGVLDAPGLRLVIQPKIPLRNVFYFLDPSAPLPPPSGREQPGAEVLDFLAGRLAEQMMERARAGLHCGYREREVQGTYLQGRLNVPAQLRDERAQRREQLHCHHDSYGADIPCNQAIRSAAQVLLSCPLLSEPGRGALRRALAGFAEVAEVRLDSTLVECAEASRPPPDYGPVLDTCRVLAESVVQGEAPAFLLDLERLFERYVTRGVGAAFAGKPSWNVLAQQPYPLGEGTAQAPGLVIRPDVTIERSGQAMLVLDVKWKRLPREAVVTEDVYQVTAYCTALGARRGVLIYPGRRERCWEYNLGEVRLAVRTLDVAGEPARCERSLRRLGRWLRRQA
jgi:5-methylcytosine-specific restriction enzyme subunit McrC